MTTLYQQSKALFREYLNEQSHSELKDKSSQNYPSYTNTTLTYPNILQPQQAIAHSAFAYPMIQQQIPTPTQPQINSKHIYDPKKSGIVNEIIKCINDQNQKLLQRVLLTEEKITKFNYYTDFLIKRCEDMNQLEQKYKRHYCELEEKLNTKFESLHKLESRIGMVESYQKILQEQYYRWRDLIIFIYKYLDGKKKKKYLKNAMIKIIGNDNRDLRKYKLNEPIQLKDIYISSKDIGITSFASSDITDQNDHFKTPTTGDIINKNNNKKDEPNKFIKTPVTGDNITNESKENKSNNKKEKIEKKIIKTIGKKTNKIIKNKTKKLDISSKGDKKLDEKLDEKLNEKSNEKSSVKEIMKLNTNDNKIKNSKEKEFEKKEKEINKKKSKQLLEIIETPTVSHHNKTNTTKINKKQQNNPSKRANKQNNNNKNNNNKKRFIVKQKKNKKKTYKKNSKTKSKIKKVKNINNNNLKHNNIKENPPDNPFNGDPSGPFWKEQLEHYGYTEDYQEVYKFYKPKASIKDYFESIELLEEIYMYNYDDFL